MRVDGWVLLLRLLLLLLLRGYLLHLLQLDRRGGGVGIEGRSGTGRWQVLNRHDRGERGWLLTASRHGNALPERAGSGDHASSYARLRVNVIRKYRLLSGGGGRR